MAHVLDPDHLKSFRVRDGTNYSYVAISAQPSKPTFLLLHGFPDSAYDWRHLLRLLKPTGAGILAPDLLGYGKTDHPTDPAAYRQRLMAGHMDELLTHELGADGRVISIAHDWGVGTQSAMAVWHPQRTLALVALAVGFSPPGKVDIDAMNATSLKAIGYERFGYWYLHDRDDAHEVYEKHHDRMQRILHSEDTNTMIWAFAVRGGAEAHATGDQPIPPLAKYISEEELATHREVMLEKGYVGPLNWYKAAVRNLGREDVEGLSRDDLVVHQPYLWLAATRDTVVVPALSQGVVEALVPNATRVDLDSSHWVMLEKPDETVAEVKKFVAAKLGIQL